MLPYPSEVGSFCFFSDHANKPLTIVSSCLMGNKVRYDGQAKRHAGLFRQLLPYVQPLVVCPEAMAGLGIPRPPVQLIMRGEHLDAVGRDDPALQVTARLEQMGRIQDRAHPLLAGALLQSRSPSCGVASTPRYDAAGHWLGDGAGLFVAALTQARPWLPMLEDTAFDFPDQRQRFLLKSYLCSDWLWLKQSTPDAWRWALDFFRHHDDSIRQLTLADAETLQSLFLDSAPRSKRSALRQTIDLFLVSKAGNYSR